MSLLGANAHQLGTAVPAAGKPLIATGHQAWLWHPGILAKDLAMAGAAARLNAGAFHLVVDQDVHDALKLELPVVRDGLLAIETIHLAPADPTIPTGCHSPADPAVVVQRLDQAKHELGDALAADMRPIADAWKGLGACYSLAQQITVVLGRLRAVVPHSKAIPILLATQLPQLPAYQAVVQQMLAEARRCVSFYNQAARDHPDAGVAPLRVERDRVELPLWALQWGRPRACVFADLAGSPPLFVLEDGQPIQPVDRLDPDSANPGGDQYVLAPRALLMTAVMRSVCCEGFIHGRGGGRYDQVTESWWRAWLGRPLAPIWVVSADLTMGFDVPVADAAEWRRAQWWLHHLPHNIDRAVPHDTLDPAQVAEKRRLIDHMDDDRDTARRAAGFNRLHQINRGLARAHPGAFQAAQQRYDRARLGVANQRVAGKRDWCFGLYPLGKLQALAEALGVGVPCGGGLKP